MSDKQQHDWREGLTAGEIEMVEKAVRVASESYWNNRVQKWDEVPADKRDSYCSQMLAGLRAIGVIPPAKVKTRGEAVAETMVPLGNDGTETLCIFHPIENLAAIRLDVRQARSHRFVRQYIAAAIDAERDAARSEALIEAADLAAHRGFAGTAVDLRTMAQRRPHLRDDVAQPHESAASA